MSKYWKKEKKHYWNDAKMQNQSTQIKHICLSITYVNLKIADRKQQVNDT